LKPEALLFDLGGVVFTLDWNRAFACWSRHSRVPIADIRARYRFDAPYERHERGEIGESEYYASLRRSLGIDLTDAQFAEGWGAIFVDEIAETVELLRSIRTKVPLYAFSNSNPAHARVWRARFAAALPVFRKVFVSYELGARKPERAAFEAIAREIGVAPERILFFDDTAENVAGARTAGVQAVLVRTPQGVGDVLRPWLEPT
jgi:putative hydrolase of the HAD superfamily